MRAHQARVAHRLKSLLSSLTLLVTGIMPSQDSKGFAALAQLVEQFIRNEKVASSNPASGTKN